MGPIFASMLVELAFEKQGKVKDVKAVLSTSDKYRQDQDYLAEFAKEKIQKQKDGKIKRTEIMEEFKNWYIMNMVEEHYQMVRDNRIWMFIW